MHDKRLLERIREMEQGTQTLEISDPVKLQESILNHLTKVLNTRQESAIIGSEFGIPDFSALTTTFNSAAIATIEKSLLEVVSRYERRIKNVRVFFVPDPKDPLKMQFSLEGEIPDQLKNIPVVFQTVLTSTGRISVRKSGSDVVS